MILFWLYICLRKLEQKMLKARFYFLFLDLYEFAKNKTVVTGLAFSPDGKRFATLSTDRRVRVFTFLTGKMIRVFDETLPRYQEMQQTKHSLPNMEFGRK